MNLIIGPGAIGSYLGVCLQNQNEKVGFFGRGGAVSTQLQLTYGDKTTTARFAAPTALGEVEIVFIAVGAHDLEWLIDHWPKGVNPQAPVVFLCNGAIDLPMADFARRHPQQILRRGLVTRPVTYLGGKSWSVVGNGKVIWGPWWRVANPERVTQVEERIVRAAASEGWDYSLDAQPLVKKKWLFNVALNSLCGAKNLATNGEVLRYEPLLKSLFGEAYDLAQKLWGKWNQDKSALYQELLKLIDETRLNENSMARDVRLGQPTESAYLAGCALAYPGSFGELESVHQSIIQQTNESPHHQKN